MLTIKDGIVLKGQDLTPVRENIVIDDGKIIEMAKDVCEGKIIDATDSIVCPTFLNGHTHIGDSIIKDEGYGLSLGEMVKPPNGVKHKALANAEDGEIIDAMKKSMWDMFESGTTHFIDYREGGIKGVELLRKASKNLPVTPVILGRDDSFYGQNPDLRKVTPPQEQPQAQTIDLAALIEQLQKSPELANTLAALIAGQKAV